MLHEFAPVNFEGGRLLRVRDGVGEYSVPLSLPPCALCAQTLPSDDNQRCVVIQPDGSNVAYAHVECMLKTCGGRDRVQGWHEKLGHPDCAVCGQPWDDHLQYGYETLCCPTWDGDAAAVQLYQHAPGHVGVLREPWLVDAGHPSCGCHEQASEEAA